MKPLFREKKQGSQSSTPSGTTQADQNAAHAQSRSQSGPIREASDPTLHSEQRELLPDGEIAQRAYAIWLTRGRPDGTHRDDWFEAERQLRKERGPTHTSAAEQAREDEERRKALNASPTMRDRMVKIGRGNQQAGRGNS
jgi:hypothetical protein